MDCLKQTLLHGEKTITSHILTWLLAQIKSFAAWGVYPYMGGVTLDGASGSGFEVDVANCDNETQYMEDVRQPSWTLGWCDSSMQE